jgi:hypothetical protein
MVGQMMKATKGQANASLANQIVRGKFLILTDCVGFAPPPASPIFAVENGGETNRALLP